MQYNSNQYSYYSQFKVADTLKYLIGNFIISKATAKPPILLDNDRGVSYVFSFEASLSLTEVSQQIL